MSRRFGEPISVTVAEGDGQPVAFTWRGVTYAVQVLSRWRLRTYWWDPHRATERTYYRVCTADHQVFEVYLEGVTGGWVLDVCQD